MNTVAQNLSNSKNFAFKNILTKFQMVVSLDKLPFTAAVKCAAKQVPEITSYYKVSIFHKLLEVLSTEDLSLRHFLMLIKYTK